MRRTRVRRTGALLAFGCVTVVAGAVPSGARADGLLLGNPVRVVDQRMPACAEAEPEIAVTTAGTWVAYNAVCEPVAAATYAVSVTLLPADGGPARQVDLGVPAGWGLGPDPELVADPGGGGVYFAALGTGDPDHGGTSVQVFRITPELAVTRLPSPSVGFTSGFDDKEFAAVDSAPGSPWFGRLYVVWQEPVLKFRAYDGTQWVNEHVFDGAAGGDIVVGAAGEVVVAYRALDDVRVVVSHDGGATFGDSVLALTGGSPGRLDPTCVRDAVGPRQRVNASVRVAIDGIGDVHVVAALDRVDPAALEIGTGNGGTAAVWHATSADGLAWQAGAVSPPGPDVVQWAPAIARTPGGGVAVDWLQAEGLQQRYDAYLAVRPGGSTSFGTPMRLSPASSLFVSANESRTLTPCYGIGDYIGLAPSPDGVVAAWPTEGTVPGVDSDVYVREVVVAG